MPEIIDIDTLAQDVRKGDHLLHNGRWVEITDVKRGPKNATFTYAPSGTRTSSPLTEDRRVRRSIETQAEKDAKLEATYRAVVDDAVRTLRDWAAVDVHAEAAKMLMSYGEHGLQSALGWEGAKMVQLDVRRNRAIAALDVIDREDNPIDAATMLVWFEKTTTEEAMRLSKRALSRSTSAWSNIVDDSVREALFDMLDYGGISGYALQAARWLVDNDATTKEA